MIALDENELAIQPFFKLPIFFHSAFFTAFEDEITQKEDCIVRLYPLIMPVNDRFIHFLSRLKRPFAIGNDIKMRKVII